MIFTTALFDLPSWSDFTDAVAPTSAGMFDTLLPIAEWGIGIIIGVAVVLILITLITRAIHSATRHD